MAKEIVEIPTERLLPNPYQPRKQFSSEEMLGLADSIQQNGVLQPLLARRINNSDYYELIAGERRLRASILANLQTVPCIVLDCDYQDSAVISILENIQRANLNFFEEALAIAHLHEHFGRNRRSAKNWARASQRSPTSCACCDCLPMCGTILRKKG